MPFQVLESFTQSAKTSAIENEDRIVITPHHAAMLDGATGSTSFTNAQGKNQKGGWLAAQTVAEVIQQLSPTATCQNFITQATQALAPFAAQWDGTNYRACTQAVIYSAHHQQIWRIGDCHIRIDNTIHLGGKEIDTIVTRYRAANIRALALLGKNTLDELANETNLPNRPWRSLVGLQGAFQNHPTDPLGYGVLDGTPVPAKFIEVFSTQNAHHIVLTSDGFPTPTTTLQEGLSQLAQLKQTDPLLTHHHQANLPFLPNQTIYDDTTYLRLQIT